MVMEQSVFECIGQSCSALKLDLSSSEMASFAEKNDLTQQQLDAVNSLL